MLPSSFRRGMVTCRGREYFGCCHPGPTTNEKENNKYPSPLSQPICKALMIMITQNRQRMENLDASVEEKRKPSLPRLKILLVTCTDRSGGDTSCCFIFLFPALFGGRSLHRSCARVPCHSVQILWQLPPNPLQPGDRGVLCSCPPTTPGGH